MGVSTVTMKFGLFVYMLYFFRGVLKPEEFIVCGDLWEANYFCFAFSFFGYDLRCHVLGGLVFPFWMIVVLFFVSPLN